MSTDHPGPIERTRAEAATAERAILARAHREMLVRAKEIADALTPTLRELHQDARKVATQRLRDALIEVIAAAQTGLRTAGQPETSAAWWLEARAIEQGIANLSAALGQPEEEADEHVH